MMEWMPIGTAPIEPFNKERWYMNHSPYLLLAQGRRVFMGCYGFTERGKGRWQDHHGRNCNPDHWMPIPKAPEGDQA